jgi:uncharacterized OB-fold protein
MSEYTKPLPRIDDANRPYWDALRRHELRMLSCSACGHLRYYPFRHCPRCGSEEGEWLRLSGKGVVWSVGIFHQVYFEGFRPEVPYNVVVVQLEEGPRVYSNIVGTPNAEIGIGDSVEAVFEEATPEVTLLKFRITGKNGEDG